MADIMAEKQVTFYPTYAYQRDENWVMPLRIWVREHSDLPMRMAASLIRRVLRNKAGLEWLSVEQKQRFTHRAEAFIADQESRERVAFIFDNDPLQEVFVLSDEAGYQYTDFNGHLQGELRLSQARAQQLLAAQASKVGWLSYQAVSPNHTGQGQVRLIESQGLSVISDIDDTIKVTGFNEGMESVLKNTFFDAFKAAPGMVERYRAMGDAVCFHYVSGSPWQLYPVLSDFLFGDEVNFPLGSMHMKNVRTNPLESESYQDMWRLLAGGTGDATIDQKLDQIGAILQHFPERQFMLIGDSGEHDPEIFSRVRARYPQQVYEICIRDVAGDAGSGRLDGMTVIDV